MSKTKTKTDTIAICRDQDCPQCGWVETFTEGKVDGSTLTPVAVGCRKCGWRQEIASRQGS